MNKIPASEFKARCLKIMDRVQHTREPVIITKKGRPVAKLVPAESEPKNIFGCLKGKIEIAGDIEAPVVAPEDWEILR